MPTYDYFCENCGHELEVFQLMSASPLTDCPSCESASLKRKIGLGAGFIFKGGGFYETDFKEKKGKADPEPATKKEESGKGEGKKETPSSGNAGDNPKSETPVKAD